MRPLTVARLFPHATVAAGDEANAAALVRRGAARGLSVRSVKVNRAEDLADADIYLLGGTGRSSTAALVDLLGQSDFARRISSGSTAVLAVDAGMDALGRSWIDERGRQHPGLDILGIATVPATAVTASVITRPSPTHRLPAMVGWIATDVIARRDPGLPPLAEVDRGPAEPGFETDGAITDRVVATRLHGPVLALNPELADLVLARVVGEAASRWQKLPVPAVERARAIRIAEIRTHPARRRRGLRR